MNQKQIEALKYLIIKSKDANNLMKRALFFLIEKSDGLTKEVSMTLWENETFSRSAVDAAAKNYMRSNTGGTTHLNELMTLMGSDLCFTWAYGHYTNGKFDTGSRAQLRYTFWLAKEMHGDGEMGEHFTPSPEELNGIKLVSSLYEHTATTE